MQGDGETTGDWAPTRLFTGPCAEDALARASESHAISGGGGDGAAAAEAYLVFDTAERAVSYMAWLRSESRACESRTGGETRGLVEELAGPWGEGVAFTHYATAATPTGGPVVLAVRLGRAVALSMAAGPFNASSRVDAGLIRAARPGVEFLYPQLCRYTEGGC